MIAALKTALKTATGPRVRDLFALDALFFSWSQSFLVLNSVLLVVVVPASLVIRAAITTPGLAAFFPHAFTILLTVYAINFGQTQADPDRPWCRRLGRNWLAHAVQLAVRLSLLLALTLPLWAIFHRLFHLSGWAILALVYLWLQAQLWGWFGLWLQFRALSEINQFKVKYLSLMGFFAATFFLPPLNPLISMELLLAPEKVLTSLPQIVLSFGGVLGLLALLGLTLQRLRVARVAGGG